MGRGAQGAQQVALKTAAIETLARGYDRFVIAGARSANNLRIVGRAPVTANTWSNTTGTVQTFGRSATYSGTGSSTTRIYGGTPIIGGSHDQGLAVRMFKPDDPGYDQALSAKQTLGPKWQEAVQKGAPRTCWD